jgi:hypothetical protein
MGWEDEHIANPANRGTIRHDAGEADLLIALIYPKAEAILDRFAHDTHRSTYRPMGCGVEKVVDHTFVYFGFIGADTVLFFLPLHGYLIKM